MNKFIENDLEEFHGQRESEMGAQGDCHFARELFNTWSRGFSHDIGPIEVFDYQWVNQDTSEADGRMQQMINNNQLQPEIAMTMSSESKQELITSNVVNTGAPGAGATGPGTNGTINPNGPGALLSSQTSGPQQTGMNGSTTYGMDLNEGQPEGGGGAAAQEHQPEGGGLVQGGTAGAGAGVGANGAALPYKLHQETPGGANV